MPIRQRKLFGTIILLAWMLAYAAGAMLVAVHWLPDSHLARLLYYPVAGLLWVAPVRPLLFWMRG